MPEQILGIIGAFLVIFIVAYLVSSNRSEKPQNPAQTSPEPSPVNPYLAQIETSKELSDTLRERVSQLEEKESELVQNLRQRDSELATEVEKNRKLNSSKISQSVKVGLVVENLAPLLAEFPYDSKKVRGLYNPIDFIVFEDEEIVFVEVKSQNSKLSQKQKKIRDMVKNGKVRFEVFKVKDSGIEIEKA